ncbi:MAG: GGDEF domain-containing protein [Limnochordia bacterium]|nr:GGDEF domain-containing protein [Limnochordia bacterium]
MKRYLIYTLILLGVIFPSHPDPLFAQPRASQGILELPSWDFSQQGSIALRGQWEFYWKQLLAPADFASSSPELTGYMELPRQWNGYVVDGDRLPGEGYATFRLHVIAPGADRIMALHIPYMGTAYKMWINGELIAENGVVADRKANMVPEYAPLTVHFVSLGETTEILVQISNFHHRRGGMWQPITLGNCATITRGRERRQLWNMFLLGGVFFISIVHLGLYLFNRNQRESLYFAIFSLLLGGRTLFLDEILIQRILPGISWEWLLKIEYLAMYLAVPVFAAFTQAASTKLSPPHITKGYLITSTAFSIFTLLTPAVIYTKALLAFQLVIVSAIVYFLYATIKVICKEGHSVTLLYIGSILIALTVIYDILFYQNILKTEEPGALRLTALLLVETALFTLYSRNTSKLALIDPVTEIYNRNMLYQELDRVLATSKRFRKPCSLAIIDIDQFKKYNDTYGHLQADTFLHKFAQFLKRSIRRSDLVARFGGDEFVIILPATAAEQALAVMQRLKAAVDRHFLPTTPLISISVGVSTYPDPATTQQELLEQADQALYGAKQVRNNVRHYQQIVISPSNN